VFCLIKYVYSNQLITDVNSYVTGKYNAMFTAT